MAPGPYPGPILPRVLKAYKAYMDRNLLSARTSDRQQFLDWIGASEYKAC